MLCAKERTSLADRLGLGRQFDRLLTHDAPSGEVGQLGSSLGRGEIVQQRGGPAHVEVGVVLPRDGDAAVHLRVQVGAQVSSRRGEGRCNGGGIAELVAAGGCGAGGVPHGARGEFGGDGHVGAVVLHGLVHGDRTAELDALLRVGGAHLGALACHAHGVGRQDHPGEIDQRAASAGDHRHWRTVEGDAGAAAARVEVGRRVDRDAVADLDDGDVVADRDEHDRGQPGAEHDTGIAAGRSRPTPRRRRRARRRRRSSHRRIRAAAASATRRRRSPPALRWRSRSARTDRGRPARPNSSTTMTSSSIP